MGGELRVVVGDSGRVAVGDGRLADCICYSPPIGRSTAVVE